MTARSLLNLILKILGVFFLKDVLDALSRSASVLIYFPQYASRREALYNLGVTLPALVLYGLFVILLLVRTNTIIRFFRLDKGLGEQPIPIRLHRSVILCIAVIAAGGWLLMGGLPEFVRQRVYYYQERKLYVRMARPDLSYLAMAFMKLLLGIILISFNRRIVSLIEAKRKNQGPWYWPARAPFVKRRQKKVV